MVSFGGDEMAWHRIGDSCTTLWIYSKPLNCTPWEGARYHIWTNSIKRFWKKSVWKLCGLFLYSFRPQVYAVLVTTWTYCVSQFIFTERTEALQSHRSVWELNRGLSFPRLWHLEHATLWAPVPTYLSDGQNESAQTDGKWQKIKTEGAVRKDMPAGGRKLKGRRRSRKDGASEEWGPRPAHLESGPSSLELSSGFQWRFEVSDVRWEGGVGLRPEACAIITRLHDLRHLNFWIPYPSNFIWVPTKQRHFLYF